jgi:SAM-dependent methyltransferase
MMEYCTVSNPTKAMCVFFDGRRSVSIPAGASVSNVMLTEPIRKVLARTWPELTIKPADLSPYKAVPGKPPLRLNGMHGIGDVLHQRSVVRELMKTNDVWLATCHWHVYHDLIEQGLKLIFQPTKLRAQSKTIERERDLFQPLTVLPEFEREIKLWYRKDAIEQYGSILQAMHGNCGVPVDNPDFSLPIPLSWHDQLERTLGRDFSGGQPIMVLRQIVIRREWDSRNRNPDPVAFQALYEEARKGFFTISIADILEPVEVIEGPTLPADIHLHKAELTFEQMAALWQRAACVFSPAGFGPVLAQAVGTASIIIYGGRESYRTTDQAGAHLAPTLGIDPIEPCDCHTEHHNCGSRAIDIPASIERIRSFLDHEIARMTFAAAPSISSPDRAELSRRSSTLIFATTYSDCRERQRLTEQWITITSRLNPWCDLLIVDSASPVPLVGEDFDMPPRVEIFDFGDNVGHLSRGGRDGWGRAFCKGLDMAVERDYRHVVHIEGDSLLRVPVSVLTDELDATGKGVGTLIVKGMHREFSNWAETGLMVFTTDYLKKSRFTEVYNWPTRGVRPTPEMVVHEMIGMQLHRLKISGLRGDRNQINHDNIISLNLDWVTHCHNDIWVYDRFMEAYCPKKPDEVDRSAGPAGLSRTGMKLNLGCGTNHLPGWQNHDIDIDITRKLPWTDGAAEAIFIEHCVEHVHVHQAIRFFEEAYRVLRPGGVLRVVVPSIEKIRKLGTREYFEFTKKWGGEASLHGALTSIIFHHGHQMIWTASVMHEALLYAGFGEVHEREIGESAFEQLQGIEGHGKVIGDAFNSIESMVFEARKPGTGELLGTTRRLPSVAVVVGGAANVLEEIAQTSALLNRVMSAQPAFPPQVEWFVVNDMIARFRGECIAITLHGQNLKSWLAHRSEHGYPPPASVWTHRMADAAYGATNFTEDWRGSSGLFAVKVARERGYERIILCGVPMDQSVGHITRGATEWKAASMFRTGWIQHHFEFAPYVRSHSGWTKERLGAPDENWLAGR